MAIAEARNSRERPARRPGRHARNVVDIATRRPHGPQAAGRSRRTGQVVAADHAAKARDVRTDRRRLSLVSAAVFWKESTATLGIRAALSAAHLLGLAAGRLLRDLRTLHDPLAVALARLKQAELTAKLAFDVVDLLSSRLDKIPDRHRPDHTPAQRFRILEIKNLLGWNTELTARTFRVCPNTISNWETSADGDARVVGSTVKPTPPITRLADVVRNLVKTMLRLGMGGEDLVAQVLARAGSTVSARSIRRIGRERHPPETPPATHSEKPTKPVIARFAHHVWMMDVTVVQAFLGREFHVAALFDAFSRVPLALSSFQREPGAAAMARLVKATAKRPKSRKVRARDDEGRVVKLRIERSFPQAEGGLREGPTPERWKRQGQCFFSALPQLFPKEKVRAQRAALTRSIATAIFHRRPPKACGRQSGSCFTARTATADLLVFHGA